MPFNTFTTAPPIMATTSPHVITASASSAPNKPLAPMPGTTYHPAISMNKEWVLPPKPKPGRKPSVDTPPTKRKAQNRQAQRAFRERRAAKVSELEDLMKVKEEEDQKEKEKLMARVKQLEHSLEDCTAKLVYWEAKYSEAEDACRRERQLRRSSDIEIEMLRKSLTKGMEAVALPPRRSVHNGYMAEPAPGISGGTPAAELSEMGCGKCSMETRCECIEDAFKMDNMAAEPDASTFKRPHSPHSDSDNKRHRLSNPDTSSEIDFTPLFSARRPPPFATSASTSSSIAATAMPESCGFCSDGTTCLCAELAKERPDRSLRPPASTLPTPPESAPTNPSAANPCIIGPGSCTQCRSNPASTLFCKSLAATRPFNAQPLSPTRKNVIDKATTKGPTFNCADAFTVLSRHPGFDQAISELATWIPHLSTVPSKTTAFDIEAASVMGVLSIFDRRFGNAGKSTPMDSKDTFGHQRDGFHVEVSLDREGEAAPDGVIQGKNGREAEDVGWQDAKGRN